MKLNIDRNSLIKSIHYNSINGGSSPVFSSFEEKKSHYLLKVKIPGVSVERIHIEIKGNELYVTNTHLYMNEEFTANTFKINIPNNTEVSAIEAIEENGIIVLALPKGRGVRKDQKINIRHRK